MEEFADLLKEIQVVESGSDDNRPLSPLSFLSKKKSPHKKSSQSLNSLTGQLLENQQLSFQLASEVRTLRQQLSDEKQAKRLLTANNVNLEGQIHKLEQKQVSLEQLLRMSDNKRNEMQTKYEEERKLRVALEEEKTQWVLALQSQRSVASQGNLEIDRQRSHLRQFQHDQDKLLQYSQALELAFNEVVAENQWQKQVIHETKARDIQWAARVEQTDRRLDLITRAWTEALGAYDPALLAPVKPDATTTTTTTTTTSAVLFGEDDIGGHRTDTLLMHCQKLLSRTQNRLEKLHRRKLRSQAHVRQLLALVAELEEDLPYYQTRDDDDDDDDDDEDVSASSDDRSHQRPSSSGRSSSRRDRSRGRRIRSSSSSRSRRVGIRRGRRRRSNSHRRSHSSCSPSRDHSLSSGAFSPPSMKESTKDLRVRVDEDLRHPHRREHLPRGKSRYDSSRDEEYDRRDHDGNQEDQDVHRLSHAHYGNHISSSTGTTSKAT